MPLLFFWAGKHIHSPSPCRSSRGPEGIRSLPTIDFVFSSGLFYARAGGNKRGKSRGDRAGLETRPHLPCTDRPLRLYSFFVLSNARQNKRNPKYAKLRCNTGIFAPFGAAIRLASRFMLFPDTPYIKGIHYLRRAFLQ